SPKTTRRRSDPSVPPAATTNVLYCPSPTANASSTNTPGSDLPPAGGHPLAERARRLPLDREARRAAGLAPGRRLRRAPVPAFAREGPHPHRPGLQEAHRPAERLRGPQVAPRRLRGDGLAYRRRLRGPDDRGRPAVLR